MEYPNNKNVELTLTSNVAEHESQTHEFLYKLKTLANQNVSRSKPGYRLDADVIRFATYIRILGGPLLYGTIYRNLPLALPSLDTTNRFIREQEDSMIEGRLRTKELLQYLTMRNLPLVVALAEDATRIDGRLGYDAKTNQVSGFVLPIDKKTGMPNYLSFS